MLLTNGCAKSAVTITWNAFDNPPGTTARVEIWRTGHATPFDIIDLSTLSGSPDVELPTGIAEFRLVAARYLNGRTITAERRIEVQGFQDHDIWSFNLTADCVQVGGTLRWGVEVLFASTVSPHLAVEEIYSANARSTCRS